jgi:TPR repeat protein
MLAAPVAIGDTIGGRYRIEGLVGEGGMATVYRARHLGTGRPCALKLVHAHLITQPHLVELFIREAQVGSQIGPNPHIVDVLDAAADDARRVPYLVMELLQGATLDRWCAQNGPMPPALVRDVFEQLGDALGQAHRAGVVHRDLKPSNLFLSLDHRGHPLLKVLDFGIAKILEADPQHTATQIGTPAYAAPEQFGAMFRPLAERQGIVIAPSVTTATDIWPIGLIAYELLTGARSGQFWDTTTLAELPIKAVLTELEPPSRRAGERSHLLPPGFDEWFARCLRKNSAERWPSVGHAVAELARLLPAGAPQVGAAPPVPIDAPPAGAYGAGYTQAGSQQNLPGGGAYAPTYRAPAPSDGAPSPFGPPAGLGSGPFGAMPAASAPFGAGPHPMTGPPGAPPMWPGAPPLVPPAPARSSSAAVWVIPLLIGGVFVVSLLAALGVHGFRRYRMLAAAHECEANHARCEEACDASDMASCARLGLLLEVGTAGTPRDLSKAAERYKEACDGGDLGGCAHLGRFHLTGRGGVTKDTTEARMLITRACDGGVQRGCAMLGQLARDGEAGVPADDARAVTLFRGACDAKVMVACKDLAGMHEYGRGGLLPDVTRAAGLYKQACDGGDPAGCNDLGVMTNNGTGTTKDAGAAAALYKKACEGGEPIGCTNLGSMYEHGKGVPKDESRALALYTQACDDASPGGCAALGILNEYGKAGLPKDPAKAVTLYRRACDARHAYGCYYLGTMEENGQGIAKDEAAAVKHYRLACEADNASGCNGLGVMYEYGRGGVTKDEAKAGGYYKQSCEKGVFQACANYGLLLAYGRGMTKDYTRALPYFKQACDGDNAAGCSNMGYQLLKGLGTPRDAARGMELLRRGCAASYEWACDQVKANPGAR